MKKSIFLIFFFLIFFSMQFVNAFGFYPTSLTFEIEKNEEKCLDFSVDSDSNILTLEDRWAENKEIPWKTTLFNEISKTHSLTLDYPEEIVGGTQVIEVCVSGRKSGEYHGVLLIKQEEQNNALTQMGLWLKVIVKDKVKRGKNILIGILSLFGLLTISFLLSKRIKR